MPKACQIRCKGYLSLFNRLDVIRYLDIAVQLCMYTPDSSRLIKQTRPMQSVGDVCLYHDHLEWN